MLLLVEVRVAAVLPGLVVESGQQAAEMQWLAAVRIEVWHWYRPRRSYIGVVLRRYLSRVPFHASGTTKLRPVFFNPCLVYRKNDVLVQPHDDGWDSGLEGRIVHLPHFVPRPELGDLVCCVSVYILRSGRCHILVMPLSCQGLGVAAGVPGVVAPACSLPVVGAAITSPIHQGYGQLA